jgi:hypothetical protein
VPALTSVLNAAEPTLASMFALRVDEAAPMWLAPPPTPLIDMLFAPLSTFAAQRR